jgi:hypothetical protein
VAIAKQGALSRFQELGYLEDQSDDTLAPSKDKPDQHGSEISLHGNSKESLAIEVLGVHV